MGGMVVKEGCWGKEVEEEDENGEEEPPGAAREP